MFNKPHVNLCNVESSLNTQHTIRIHNKIYNGKKTHPVIKNDVTIKDGCYAHGNKNNNDTTVCNKPPAATCFTLPLA
jgi:hypothetical protein